MANLLPVAFHGDTLYLVEHNGEPFAPMKPIAENLGLQDEQWQLVFQSRFGKAEWLKPYCVEALAQLPSLRFIGEIHQNPRYIQAVADSVRAYWQQHGQADPQHQEGPGVGRHAEQGGARHHVRETDVAVHQEKECVGTDAPHQMAADLPPLGEEEKQGDGEEGDEGAHLRLVAAVGDRHER